MVAISNWGTSTAIVRLQCLHIPGLVLVDWLMPEPAASTDKSSGTKPYKSWTFDAWFQQLISLERSCQNMLSLLHFGFVHLPSLICASGALSSAITLEKLSWPLLDLNCALLLALLDCCSRDSRLWKPASARPWQKRQAVKTCPETRADQLDWVFHLVRGHC